MKKLFAEKVDEIKSYNNELLACHQQFENTIDLEWNLYKDFFANVLVPSQQQQLHPS